MVPEHYWFRYLDTQPAFSIQQLSCRKCARNRHGYMLHTLLPPAAYHDWVEEGVQQISS